MYSYSVLHNRGLLPDGPSTVARGGDVIVSCLVAMTAGERIIIPAMISYVNYVIVSYHRYSST